MLNRNFFNDSISDIDKDILITEINKILLCFKKYNVELDLENSKELFKNLIVVTEFSDKDFIAVYDEYTNKLTQNFGCPNFTVQRYEGELINALIEIVSRKYDFEANKYDKGLMCKSTDLRYHGLRLNNMIREYLSTIITGYSKENDLKDSYYDSRFDYLTLPDRVIYDLTCIYGSEYIMDCFVNGNGQKLYHKIANTLGSEKNAIMLYNSIDNYNSDRVVNRRIYDTNISELKEKEKKDTMKY